MAIRGIAPLTAAQLYIVYCTYFLHYKHMKQDNNTYTPHLHMNDPSNLHLTSK